MAAPLPPHEQCGIRGCGSSVSVKEIGGYQLLVCDVASHHRAWLIQKGAAWGWSTRGRSGVKGVVTQRAVAEGDSRKVEPPVKEDQTLAELARQDAGPSSAPRPIE